MNEHLKIVAEDNRMSVATSLHTKLTIEAMIYSIRACIGDTLTASNKILELENQLKELI